MWISSFRWQKFKPTTGKNNWQGSFWRYVTLRTDFVSAANIFVQQSRNGGRPLFRIFRRNSRLRALIHVFLPAEGNIIQLHFMKKAQKYFFWQLQSRDLIICTVTTKMIISPLSPGYLMAFPPRKLFCALLGFLYNQRFVNRPTKHISEAQPSTGKLHHLFVPSTTDRFAKLCPYTESDTGFEACNICFLLNKKAKIWGY